MSTTYQHPNMPLFNPPSSPHDFSGDNLLGLYATETTQRHMIGRRYITWDGRVFKYGLCAANVTSYHGAGSTATHNFTPEALGVAISVGDTDIFITQTGFVDDELAGCYLILYGASDHAMNRMIVSNDASGATTTKLTLDGPITIAVTSAYAEIFNNPWKYLTHAADYHQTIVCVPAVKTSATYYVWGQTWGPCVVSPGEAMHPPTNEQREVVWGTNGSLFDSDSAADTYKQHAGFLLNATATLYGPLIMLQISV